MTTDDAYMLRFFADTAHNRDALKRIAAMLASAQFDLQRIADALKTGGGAKTLIKAVDDALAESKQASARVDNFIRYHHDLIEAALHSVAYDNAT